ncbi:MAG: hypothetical protein ACI4TB_04890 [Lachnospiraceae bacterium]
MGIGGVSDYSSLFRNYRVPEIPSVDVEQVKRAEAAGAQQPVQELKPQQTSQDIDLSIEEKQPAKPGITDVNNISLTFNAGDDYGYIGKDSDLNSLDMQKAISDMKKDQVLQQYQYFVGNAENLLPKNASEDGLVFLKF